MATFNSELVRSRRRELWVSSDLETLGFSERWKFRSSAWIWPVVRVAFMRADVTCSWKGVNSDPASIADFLDFCATNEGRERETKLLLRARLVKIKQKDKKVQEKFTGQTKCRQSLCRAAISSKVPEAKDLLLFCFCVFLVCEFLCLGLVLIGKEAEESYKCVCIFTSLLSRLKYPLVVTPTHPKQNVGLACARM